MSTTGGVGRRRSSRATKPGLTPSARARASHADAVSALAEAQSVRSELFVSRLMLVLVVLSMAGMWAAVPIYGAALALRLSVVAAIVAAYFGLSWQLLRRRQLAGLGWRRLASATLEPTLATLVLHAVATEWGAASAAASPAFMLYAIAIAVGACRMRPALCVYAAALGGAQFLVLYLATIEPALPAAVLEQTPTLALAAMFERVAWLLVLAVIVAVATARMRALAVEGGEHSWHRTRVEREFGRFVSPDVMHAILRGDAGPGAAERREVSVLFCDLRDFTGLCERMAPERVVELLNTFYEQACGIVGAHGGTVNKFLGDGMLALFGAPDEHPNHAHAAAEAAREISAAVDELRTRGEVWSYLDVGIGIDTGAVVCGAVGAQSRLEYTAIGSIVNRAARLQGLAGRAGHRVVISGDAADRLGPRAGLERYGEVPLKGFDAPVPVYVFGAA